MPASFSQTVEIPLWLAWLGGLLAAWALSSLTLWPLLRGHFRRRALLLVERMNARLKLAIPTYKMANREALIGRLVADPRLLEAMNEEQRATGESAAVIARKVERYAREIVPAFRPYFYFRTGAWLARAVARSLYRVRLGYADAGTMAVADPQASVVFVMNHRSNMDYVLLAHLAADQVALSYAVGEWAQVFPVSQIVRALGAFFVRRGSGNALYRRVLERYVQLATEGGIVQVVYPEGGLTRDGFLRAPKLGLLDYMARAFDPTGPRDLVFVPVAVNYDRVLEDRNLLAELDPAAPKLGKGRTVARFLGWLWRNLRLRLRGGWYRFGYAVVNVGRAISLRSYAAARGLDFRTLPREERLRQVEVLAQALMREVGAIVPVVPAALLARVFVEAGDQALDDLGWKAAAEGLLERLQAAHAQIYVPRRDRAYALEAGLRMLTLRRLIRLQSDGTLLADPAPENARVLRYYANSIAHLLPPTAELAPTNGAKSA